MRQTTLLIAALFIFFTGTAQNGGSRLYHKVTAAHTNGTEFVKTTLFTIAGKQSDNYVKQSQQYKPHKSNITQLYTSPTDAISITLQSATGQLYTLEFLESHPTSSDARIGYIDNEGKHTTPYELGLHYNGIVKGKKQSVAAMSIFANGEVMLFFSCKEGNFIMGKMQDTNGVYVLYNTSERLKEIPFSCAVPDTGELRINNRAANKTTGDIECKKLKIYWEVDYTFYQSKGTVIATQNYLTGLFNFMQSIYYNDGMAVEMSSMYIWTVDDPITTTTAWDASWQFQRYWLALGHTYYGDQASLIANFNGWQGYAYIGAICFPNGYAAINLTGTQTSTYPAFDADLYLVAHETGHTLGSQHTQSCSWKTGTGGTCGSIDNCVTQEGGAGCSTCFYLNDANATGFMGTVMSYCGSKINFSAGFGPIVGNFLHGELSSGTCFSPVINPQLSVQDICNSDGAITLNYQTNNFGVAPYTYLWSNSQNTKDIAGLAVPNTYSVTITDSNNCTATTGAAVKHHAKPGDGNALQGIMPYCCKDTFFNVTVNATLPTNLTSCQTVAWLRTKQPLTSYAAAKIAFTNASSNDILPSDNSTSINNSTSAQLTIASPSKCDTTTQYYYTPYVARKALNKMTYNTNATGATPIKNVSTNLGTTITLAAQSNVPSTCESYRQNITDTITVAISNYTGRTNRLTIRINGADKKLLHLKANYLGNGTYQIPITGIDNHFQEMTIMAYDFNCTNAQSCTASSLNIQASKKVIYEALPMSTFDSSCVVGKSVLLSFGPTNCNNVSVIKNLTPKLNHIKLYPNPTTQYTTLYFNAISNGTATVQITDMLGRNVVAQEVSYKIGSNSFLLQNTNLTKGIYTVSIEKKHIKLVIE